MAARRDRCPTDWPVAVCWLVSAAMRLLNAKIKISSVEGQICQGFLIRFYTHKKEKEMVE